MSGHENAGDALERLPADARARLDQFARALESVLREFAHAQLRVSYVGVNSVPGLGSTDEGVRMMRSLGDAVAGIVLWDRLAVHDRDELLGLWSRLLP